MTTLASEIRSLRPARSLWMVLSLAVLALGGASTPSLQLVAHPERPELAAQIVLAERRAAIRVGVAPRDARSPVADPVASEWGRTVPMPPRPPARSADREQSPPAAGGEDRGAIQGARWRWA